eukprot:scaffold80999_cov23-Tisochrysis_lutea.AAC.2
MELGFYPDAATAERRQLSLDGTNRMHVHRMHRMHVMAQIGCTCTQTGSLSHRRQLSSDSTSRLGQRSSWKAATRSGGPIPAHMQGKQQLQLY